MCKFVKIQQSFSAAIPLRHRSWEQFWQEQNFFPILFPKQPLRRQRHNLFITVDILWMRHWFSTEKGGRQFPKIQVYLLKTRTFPHSPQVSPQGFSTGTKGCNIQFSLHKFFRQYFLFLDFFRQQNNDDTIFISRKNPP